MRRKRKRANGTGSITPLKGNLKNPYWVRAGKERKSLGTFRTYKEAVAALDEYNANPYDVDSSFMNFKELCEIFLKTKKGTVSEDTYKAYSFKLNHCKTLDYMLIKDIKAPHLQDLINNINLSSGSKREIKGFLVMVFDFAVQMEYMSLNRAKYIKLEKHEPVRDKNIFTTDEIKKLWKNKDMYFVKIILFMLYTGMRIGEIPIIRKENIDLMNAVIRDTGNKTEKAKHRIIPIHKDIFEIVQELIEISKSDYLVYIEGAKEPIHKETIRKNFHKIMKLLGMQHLPHDTRRTLASILDRSGASQTVITDIIGHADYKTTKDYYIINDEQTIKDTINNIKILN